MFDLLGTHIACIVYVYKRIVAKIIHADVPINFKCFVFYLLLYDNACVGTNPVGCT